MLLAAKVVAIVAIVAVAWSYPLIGGLTLTLAYVVTLVGRRRKPR